MTREEALEKYRRLRDINARHQDAALRHLPATAIMDWAKRLGLVRGGTMVAGSFIEMSLAFDCALYTARKGRSRAVDRYRKAAAPAPGSEEAVVLDAMCEAWFSFFQVTERPESGGLGLVDLPRGEALWLMDEGLEQSAPLEGVVAARLLKPDAFHMTTGVVVPVSGALIEMAEARFQLPEIVGGIRPEDEPGVVEAIYRTAVATGVLAESEGE